MVAACFAAALTLALVQTEWLYLKRVAMVDYGPWADPILLCADTDHDGLGEIIYTTYDRSTNLRRLEFLEYRPCNRYELVVSDTGVYPYPPGHPPVVGNLYPFDVGDVDGDGKADLVGEAYFVDAGESLRTATCTVESADSTSHPCTLNWYSTRPGDPDCLHRKLLTDLDRDSKREILTSWPGGTAVFENVADNRESLVFLAPPYPITRPVAGDFDLNGKTDFIAREQQRKELVCECVGDNNYVQVCSVAVPYVGGYDVFLGHDVDRNGWPEVFVSYACPPLDAYIIRLCAIEASREHEYGYFTVASQGTPVGDATPRTSVCADLDGDGIEEVVWSCVNRVNFLKATGPHQFEQVWQWGNDHGGPAAMCNAWDMNGNGYDEAIIGGMFKTSVLEVEAIRLHYPNLGEQFKPGDTCLVHWSVVTPPRCDSVSVFFKSDPVVPEGEWFWNLDTIATGLDTSITTWPWVVPDTTLDSAWILLIAYGPGWQYTESRIPISIISSGVAERSKPAAPGRLPEPTIVGGMLWLGPDLGHDPKSQSGSRSCPASLLDITGRKVMDLQPGENDIRHVAPGVYFIRGPETEDGRPRTAVSVRKVVIQR